ncbi:MAG: class I SAM-dependent methyltransferase [Hormoscilla sp. GM102CHS1]|nr:class I SAM-dependent methyltransferase [Hormoscilla sp. GM102CHS1]
MFEQQPETLRQKVRQLSAAAIRRDDPASWFEELYAQARGDYTQVPWAGLTLHPHAQDWFEHYGFPEEFHDVLRHAVVVGCGLGDDAEALQNRGFQVTAFDISPTAIAWCQQRFPPSSVNYQVADLLCLDSSWHHGFDFVLECRNLQALPLSIRATAIQAVGQLVAEQGTLLAIARLRETEAEPDGPPWPLSNQELAQLTTQGLTEIRRKMFLVGDDPVVKQLWVEYKRERI